MFKYDVISFFFSCLGDQSF